MTFEDSTLTLSGETRAIKSLEFFKSGVVGKTDAKGETTVVCGEYTFLVTEKSLRYRFKPKGARASKPVKTLKTFADLDKLPLGDNTKENKNITEQSAEGTKEEIIMAKLNINGKQVEIPADVTKVLNKLGVKGNVVEMNEFDLALGKAKEEDLVVLTKFEETVIEPEMKAAENKAPKAPEKKEEPAAAPNAGQPQTPPAPETKPQTPPAAPTPGSPLATSNLFTGGNTGKGRATKTEAEREAERKERELKRREEQEEISSNYGRIEDLDRKLSSVESTEEMMRSLRKLLLLEGGRLPLFATLVPSDTRLRPMVKNRIAAKDRQLHPNVKNVPGLIGPDGKIPENLSLAEYELRFVESAPSQPSGYFIYVPECLMDISPSNLSLHSERQKIADALDSGSRELVIKYFPKSDLIYLLIALGAAAETVPVQEYNKRTKSFNQNAPYIHLLVTSKDGETVYSLRAKDALGTATKLSIRRFIPLATHDTIKTTSPDFSPELTTKALFGRLLFNESSYTKATKFSQLIQEDKMLFTETGAGEYVFNSFQNSYVVPAYDINKNNSNHTVDMKLPFVREVQSASSGKTNVVFVKSKFNEDHSNYDRAYTSLIQEVGDQINKTKRRTNKAINNSLTLQIQVKEGLLDIVTGKQIKIK